MKKLFPISGAVFVLVIVTLAYQSYDFDNIKESSEFRTELEQDSQVKINESMLIKSLDNMEHGQAINS